MALVTLPLGALEPDTPPSPDGKLNVADGVLPMGDGDGWRPCPGWVADTTALPEKPKGGAAFTSPLGLSSIIVGGDSSLYRAYSGGFEAIGTGYSLQGIGRWRFAQFGGLAIATNGADAMQKIDLTDYSVSALGGSPPKFEILAVVKDFLVGGVMNGNIMALAWSAINNAEGWTFGLDQSDFQVMPSGGGITGILSGEFGVILQRDRICRMDYVGGNLIFEINEISSNIGCVSRHTVAQWGRLGFFWSQTGPMMWDGAQIIPIGEERVNRWIRDRYDQADWPLISTALDPRQGVVMWALPDRIIGYNWKVPGGRWFTLPYASPIIFSGVTRNISMDEQDPDVGSDDDIVDNPGLLSLDDVSFTGGEPTLYAFSSDYRLGQFTGTPMAATFGGVDNEFVQGARFVLRSVRPDCDAIDGLSITLDCKQRLGDSYASNTYSTLTDSGDMPVRENARFIHPTFQIAAGTTWSYAKALSFVGESGAGR